MALKSWTDPIENAFTVEVPSSWSIDGGLIRRAAVDTRAVIRLKSPDGRIEMFSGDASVPTFTLPSPMLASAGFVEGTSYSPGYGVNMIVGAYRPGVQFARAYAERIPCEGLAITAERDRTDAAAEMNEIYSRFGAYGIQLRLDAGEVAFTCRAGGQEMAGYIFAGTLLTEMMGSGGIWVVEHLYGYMAPAGRAGEAEAVLSRLASSMRLNPQWVRMQQHLTGNVSGIVAETGAFISGLIADAHAYRQHAQDESSRRFSNRMLELEDMVDPQTNESFKVESGAEHYWIDNLGTTVGTSTHDNPDANRFRELKKVR